MCLEACITPAAHNALTFPGNHDLLGTHYSVRNLNRSARRPIPTSWPPKRLELGVQGILGTPDRVLIPRFLFPARVDGQPCYGIRTRSKSVEKQACGRDQGFLGYGGRKGLGHPVWCFGFGGYSSEIRI